MSSVISFTNSADSPTHMKPNTLPVKRRPVSKGVFKRLHAVTGRKQRVAATATAEDMDVDDNSSRISRSLTIIFVFHIVVLGLIFFHQQYLNGHTPAVPTKDEAKLMPLPNTTPQGARRENYPMLSSGDNAYTVKTGDNYSRIAAGFNVDEAELRKANNDRDIQAGLMLKIPPARVTPAPVPVAPATPSAPADDGLVAAIPVNGAPKAIVVRPTLAHAETAVPAVPSASSGKTYIVQPGDSVWRIANRFKVDQNSLMKKNGISDARKLKTGMSLMIP